MQVVVPRTVLSKPFFLSSVLLVVICQIPLWLFTPFVATTPKEDRLHSEPIIVIHCIDWIKDTLPSYDLDFVLNNPLTIGNPAILASPKTEGTSPQTISSGAWSEQPGAGSCNFAIQEVEADSVRNLGFVYARAIGGEGVCKMSFFWRDRVEYSTCEEMQSTGIYAKIYRRWSAICFGARKDTVQVIAFAQPKIQDFKFNGAGTDFFDRFVHYQVCSTDKNLIKKEDVTPYVYSYFHTPTKPKTYYIDETGSKYSISYTDQDHPFCGIADTNGVRVIRNMYVFDSCTRSYLDTFRLQIRIGNLNPIVVIPSTIPDLPTDSLTCTASFKTTLTGFKNAFGIEISSCYTSGIPEVILKAKDRYKDGVLVAENAWDQIRYSTNNTIIAGLTPGRYRILFVVFTGCFGYARDSFEFVVKDKIAPKPICVNGLTINLQPDGQGGGKYTIHATDFVAAAIYDCYGQGPDTLNGKKLVTHYSINIIGEKVDSTQKSLEFNCLDANRVRLIELHAWDTHGQNGYCVTYVEVFSGSILCEIGSRVIAGTISTEGNQYVQGVKVRLSGGATQTANTTLNGGYSFHLFSNNGDYTVTPELDTEPANGVSTFDLLLIQKHILNIQVLNSPYKMIAADVNNSQSISTLDIILLRKLILGIDKHFSNNTSWRFVNAAYTFPNSTNPWSAKFPEAVSFKSSSGNLSGNFVAIKIGDVNASAKVNNSQ